MGDQEFLSLIGTNQGIIHKVCRMYRDGAEDREDLFQEITYQLWKAYPAFKGTAKAST
ncbi:MAG TPA: sigma factor [Pedobacter sp.]|nr:sigma factor [Pedobacter sp.]